MRHRNLNMKVYTLKYNCRHVSQKKKKYCDYYYLIMHMEHCQINLPLYFILRGWRCITNKFHIHLAFYDLISVSMHEYYMGVPYLQFQREH